MADLVDVSSAARELGVNASRVRALISAGVLDAEKIGGRWLIDRASLVERGRESQSAGRPLAPRNVWAFLLAASGEALPSDISGMTRWRLRQGLARHGLLGLRPRLGRRADVRRFWALPGELRMLRNEKDCALSGSSAAGAYDLELVGPDTIDAYVPEQRVADLIDEHALDAASPASANVILRAVPDDAWLLSDRRVAPLAAVALDRVGKGLLDQLDRERAER
jgi:excisionase family DNA binding protein